MKLKLKKSEVSELLGILMDRNFSVNRTSAKKLQNKIQKQSEKKNKKIN